MKPSTQVRIAAVIALVTAGLTACAGGAEHSGLTLTEGNPRAVIGDYSLDSASQSGEGQGRLSIPEGGCFRLDSGGGQEYLLIFPQGTEILSEGKPGVQIQSKRYLVGDEATFGGGYRTLNKAESRSVADCQPDGEVFLIQELVGT